MIETQNRRPCVRILAWTLLAWFLVVIGMPIAFVQSNLALPPSGDTYASSAFFQVLSFAYPRVPSLVLILVAVFACELLGCWILDRNGNDS